MILRKPYAFLIKHFRFINFLLALFSSYFAYKTFSIIRFFNEYISNHYTGSFYDGFYLDYISLSLYIALILIVLGLISLIILFIYKKRQNKIYLAAIIYYLLAFIFLTIVKNIMISMETTLLTSETARLYRDLSLILYVPQFIYILFFIMYFFGFNFNKFNFQQDLKDLQILEEDSEEVEVTFNKDNVKVKRNFRRFLREFQYYIKENLAIFIFICIIVVGLAGFLIYRALPDIVDTDFVQGDAFVFQNTTYKIDDSIITNLSYNGDVLDKYYIVVRLSVKNETNSDTKLLSNNFRLEIDDKYYYPSVDKASKFVDYAKSYFGNNIKPYSENNYSLIYELNENDIKKTYRIKVSNGTGVADNLLVGRYNYVTITPIIVNKVVTDGEYSVNEKINFNNSNLRNTTMTIKDYQIADRYIYKYNYCLRENDCKEYKNMVNLNYKSNDKTLLILGYDYDIDTTIPFYNSTVTINTIVESFFKVKYIANGIEEYATVKNVTPVNDKTKIVLEVTNKIKDADHVYLSIIVRNKEYLVSLK